MSDWYEIFERGRQVACQAHGEQRYGDKPYKNHLADVVSVLRRFDLNLDDNETAPILVAAWLHDSLEDTSLDRDFLTREFGADIAELVWLVTDEPGLSRKERKPATYRKTAKSERAIILKLADRIANVESSRQNNRGLFQMYKREHPEFMSALQPASKSATAARMWQHLNHLFSKK